LKTTELYIEQVIIGLLVLSIAALPWVPELKDTLGGINIAEGSVLLGVAFLLGIPFDRFADTLSERLDRHNRLQFALDKWVGNAFPKPKPAPELHELVHDIFAEDDFRLKVLKDKDALVNWIDYHRSRIRLVRALAVYGPALTLSLTLAMSRRVNGMPPDKIYIWLSITAAAYVLWGIITSPPKSLRKRIKKRRIRRALFGEELPRTDRRRFRKYARKWYRIDPTGMLQETTRGGFQIWSSEWRSLVVPVSVLVAALWFGIEYGFKPASKTAWVAGMGVLVTVISAWSWWRINMTYRTYLYDLGRTRLASGENQAT
jgi:hypothetical protein